MLRMPPLANWATAGGPGGAATHLWSLGRAPTTEQVPVLEGPGIRPSLQTQKAPLQPTHKLPSDGNAQPRWSGVLCVTALHTPPRRAHPLRDEEGTAPYRASHCHAANREIRICLNREHPIDSRHHLNSSFQAVFSNTGQPENVCFSNYEAFLWLGLHP